MEVPVDISTVKDQQGSRDSSASYLASKMRSWAPFARSEKNSSVKNTPVSVKDSVTSEFQDKAHARVFLDANELRQIIQEGLRKPVYDVKNNYKKDGVWSAIAKNSYFENLTLGVISFNALWLAIDTDNNTAA